MSFDRLRVTGICTFWTSGKGRNGGNVLGGFVGGDGWRYCGRVSRFAIQGGFPGSDPGAALVGVEFAVGLVDELGRAGVVA